MKIGVRKGSVQEQEIKKYSSFIVPLEETEKLFRQLNEGVIDVLVVDNSIVMEHLGMYQDIEVFCYENESSNGYGIGLRKEDRLLLKKINDELIKMQEEKTLQKLITKYHLP